MNTGNIIFISLDYLFLCYFNDIFHYSFNIGLCKNIKTTCASASPDAIISIYNLTENVRCVDDRLLKKYIDEYKKCSGKFDKVMCTDNFLKQLNTVKSFDDDVILINGQIFNDYLENKTKNIKLDIMLIVKSNLEIEK